MKKCLSCTEINVGKNHPSYLEALNNLATYFQENGNHMEAVILHRECLESRERVLGKDHPYTLESVSNLSISLRSCGEIVESDSLLNRYVETLNIQKKV
jgi:hypothetical protein